MAQRRPDVILLAGRTTLLDRIAQPQLLPQCRGMRRSERIARGLSSSGGLPLARSGAERRLALPVLAPAKGDRKNRIYKGDKITQN